MGAIGAATRSNLVEINDDRAANKAAIIISHSPIGHWHTWTGYIICDNAILNGIMQRNHHLILTGDSLRQEKSKPAKKENHIDPS